MKIEPVHCPACLAVANVPPEIDKIQCEYCGTVSIIEHTAGGPIAIKLTEEIAELKTIQGSTLNAIQDMQATNENLRRELQSLQLTHELSLVDNRLSDMKARIYSPGVISNKWEEMAALIALRQEIVALTAQRGRIQQAIDALAPVPQVTAVDDPQLKKSAAKKGCFGKIMMVMLWLLIYSVLAAITDAVIGDPVITPAIITVAIFWYFRRRRNRMAIQSQ